MNDAIQNEKENITINPAVICHKSTEFRNFRRPLMDTNGPFLQLPIRVDNLGFINSAGSTQEVFNEG